ncbi:MAG: hypothetical protein WD874_01150 [Parcubacteria group bacterium]
MNKYIIHTLIIFIFVWAGATASRAYGWYFEYWYVDIILHALSGIMFALIWTILAKGKINSIAIFMFGAVATAVLGSFLWECWEYWGYLLRPDFARFYIPEIEDTLTDMAAGMAGALLIYPFVRKIAIIKG